MCVSSRNKSFLSFLLPLFALFLSLSGIQAQQVIGTFSYMNGGFEGQAAGALGTTVSSTVWSRQSQAGASSTIITTSPRTGANCATITNVSTASRGLQSPQLTPFVAGSTPIASTPYMVQFWIKNAAFVPAFQVGTNTNGTSTTNYSSSSFYMPINTGWTKYTIATTTGSTAVTSSGIAIVGRSTGGTFDIDDVVIYPGTTEDISAPDAPTAPSISNITASTQTVSWTAPTTGVDGGGYLVVRNTTDPSTVPNANGIYSVGSFITGTDKVVYIGINPTFTDNITTGVNYFYRIYTVDKAFNYSANSAIINNNNIINTIAADPTTQTSNVSFSEVSQTSFKINFNTGNGTNNLVVLKAGTPITSDPVNGSTYTISSNVGGGSSVVYNGTGNTFTVSGLLKATTYYLKVYTFNGSAGTENYLLTTPASGSQMTLPGEITSVAAGGVWSTAATWVGGIVPTQYDNVTIAENAVITFSASGKCYNLTIPATAKVWAPTANTLGIYGTSLACAGTLGDASNVATTGSQLTVEFGGNLVISGAGSIYPWKIRPATGLSNIGITFNANTTVTYATVSMQSDFTGNDNVTFNIPAEKTLNLAGSLSTTSSSAGVGTASTIVNVNGTLTIGNTLNTTVAIGKSYTVNVNGTLNTLNLNVTPNHAVQSPSIIVTSPGVITATGTVDASSPTITGGVTGNGTFNLSAPGTINTGIASGLEPVEGPIRTTTRSFDIGANYGYVGTAAQVLGSDFPGTVNNLTLKNAAGLSLGTATTVKGILTLTNGVLNNSINNLTLGDAGTISLTGGSLTAAPIFGTTANLVYGGSTSQNTSLTTGSPNAVLSGANYNIFIGMIVNGTGVPTGTTVSAISGTALTLSQNATATATNSLTFVYNTVQTTGFEMPVASSVLSNLTVNNPAGVALNSSATANGIVTLNAGTFSLGNNDLTLGATGTIAGGSATAYIATTGNGKLTQPVAVATAKLFPIGTASSYDPVTVTATDAATFSAKVGTSLTGLAASGYNYTAKEWDLMSTAPSATLVSLTPSAVTATGVYPNIGQYDGANYVNSLATLTGNSYEATFTSFGKFVTGYGDLGTGINSSTISGVLFDGKTIYNNANVDLRVYDATGKFVLSSNKSVNMAAFANGIYFIKCELGTQKISVKK